jgi:hypothetical protein
VKIRSPSSDELAQRFLNIEHPPLHRR